MQTAVRLLRQAANRKNPQGTFKTFIRQSNM